jgi:glutathione S-transferase
MFILEIGIEKDIDIKLKEVDYETGLTDPDFMPYNPLHKFPTLYVSPSTPWN